MSGRETDDTHIHSNHWLSPPMTSRSWAWSSSRISHENSRHSSAWPILGHLPKCALASSWNPRQKGPWTSEHSRWDVCVPWNVLTALLDANTSYPIMKQFEWEPFPKGFSSQMEKHMCCVAETKSSSHSRSKLPSLPVFLWLPWEHNCTCQGWLPLLAPRNSRETLLGALVERMGGELLTSHPVRFSYLDRVSWRLHYTEASLSSLVFSRTFSGFKGNEGTSHSFCFA